jgi:VIT1/CCC1 family predicted Fe2+/Mn2+ transporter
MGLATSERPWNARLLDPVSRAGEIIFGLIMVLTFTNSLSVAEAGRADVREMLVAASGCNLAWGIIDAVMYLMATRAERRIEDRNLEALRREPDAGRARELLAGLIPAPIAEALDHDGLERVRQQLGRWPGPTGQQLAGGDYWAALWVFVLVFACTFPLVLPFLFWQDARWALAVSNVVGIVSLFLVGYRLGRASDQAQRTGLVTVTVGILLVGIAKALGG